MPSGRERLPSDRSPGKSNIGPNSGGPLSRCSKAHERLPLQTVTPLCQFPGCLPRSTHRKDESAWRNTSSRDPVHILSPHPAWPACWCGSMRMARGLWAALLKVNFGQRNDRLYPIRPAAAYRSDRRTERGWEDDVFPNATFPRSPAVCERRCIGDRATRRPLQCGTISPGDKLRSRFPRTLENLRAAIRRLPHVFVYDNSDLAVPYRQVAAFDRGQLQSLAEPVPAWLRPLLPSP